MTLSSAPPCPPLLYPCELRCQNCLLSNCEFPTPSSAQNGASPPLPTVHGIKPYKMQIFHIISAANPPLLQPSAFGEMGFDFPGCQSHHRILPPVGGLHHRVGPTELPMLDVRHCHCFQCNEIFDHEMCYTSGGMEVDVKPPKEEYYPLKTPIYCLKDEERLREIEEIEDCFILEFDPYSSATAFAFDLELLLDHHDPEFFNVVQFQQGQEVACRDYPHSRHHCAAYPFGTTPDYIHCKMCYCYVCEVPAPCEQWTESSYFKHCKATPDIEIWRDLKNAKKRNIDAVFYQVFSQI